ncbi:MAG: Rid family detoxifying hydrolase [Gemmatimonadales bacterium]
MMFRLTILLPLLSLLLSPVAAQDTHQMHHQRQAIRMPGSAEGLPYSSAIRVGPMLYLSGQVGVVPGSRTLAPGGIEAETRQVLDNIKAVLEHAGSSMTRVVKCTVFLLDIADYAAMNRVYASYFPTDPPARSAFATSGLPLNARVEIECIALVGEVM